MKKINKVFIVTMLIICAFASPLMADESLMIIINDVPYVGQDIMWKDDHIYVPVRFVSEKMGYTVNWVDGNVDIRTVNFKPPMLWGGDDNFNTVVTQALDLLMVNDPADYALVCQNLSLIMYKEKWERKDIPYASNEKTIAFLSPELTNDQKRFVPVFVAAILVHEASHSAFANSWVGGDSVRDEYIAYTQALTALELINAPQWVINETKQNRETFGTK